MSPSGLCIPLLLTILAWGYNFVALKVLYAEVAPGPAALVRHVLMWVLLLGICRIWFREDVAKDSPPSVSRSWMNWRIAVFGVLAMGIYMILFLEALDRTSASEGAIVIATAPLFTMLFAVLARQEPFSWRVLLGALVAFAGVSLVVFGGSELRATHVVGNLLMLASGIAWALGAVISRPLVRDRAAILVLTDSMPAALIVLIPYAIVGTLEISWFHLKPETYWAFAHFTLLAGVLGFVGFFIGVQKIGAPGAMLYQYGVAPLATLFAWLFLKESLHALQLVGMAVVLAGVIMATAARKRQASQSSGLDCPAEA